MFKVFNILFIFLPFFAFSGHKIERFYDEFHVHQYICFDDKIIIHDPDCICFGCYTGKIFKENGKCEYFFINPGKMSLLD